MCGLAFKIKYLAARLLLGLLAGMLLAGCAGHASVFPGPVLSGEIDEAWFSEMDALEEKENWTALQELAAYVLSHSRLNDKQRAWAFYYGGCAHLSLGHGPLALFCARQAALFLPRELKPQILHGLAELAHGNSLRGGEIMRSLAARYPQSFLVMMALGRANVMSGRPEAACAWYERAVQLEPDEPRALLALSMSYWSAGDAAGAMRNLEAAAGLYAGNSKEMAEIRNDQGIIHLALGELTEAGQAFNQAVSLDPHNPDARLNRAEFHAAHSRFVPAQADLDAGLAVRPDHAGLLMAQGRLYQAQSHYLDAYVAFEAAYVYHRKDPHVLNELAWFLATCPDTALHNGERAVGLAERAIILSRSPDPGLYDTLAAAYAAAGRFPEACDAQNTAVFLAEKAGLARTTLNDWQARLKLYERGQAYYAH